MELDQLFVLNLKKWRKNMGLSQKALAERCNAAHSYIRQIESGSGRPSFAFIGRLAHALNIEPYQLFYDEMAAPPGKAIQSEGRIESIKTEFLKKVESEFDSVIDKLKS
ncbi:MAG: helix-turn-helix domain-containing protein [Treponema sp.]|jgi:transcriptional regulator with XRE-family HTH domain|nr:helix-turn-helix domain-containing protein [Treponema sp.]